MKETPLDFDPAAVGKKEYYEQFLDRESPPAEAVRHFAAVPWTNAWLTSEAYEPIPFWSRHAKPSGEDFFFASTTNTSNTIPHMVTLRLRDLTTPEPGEPAANDTAAVNDRLPELVFLVQLGGQGLDGHPGIIHGGVTCALLDEPMSLLVTEHVRNSGTPAAQQSDGSVFTANLNVNFRAPVPTPSVVVIKCWLLRRDARKWLTKGRIEDQNGKVLADGEAIWVVVQRTKL